MREYKLTMHVVIDIDDDAKANETMRSFEDNFNQNLNLEDYPEIVCIYNEKSFRVN